MKKFLLKTALFTAIMAACASIACFFIDKGLRKTEYTQYKEWNNIHGSKINADVLIQGSSHARVQISPTVLDSILQLNTYNIGIDGYAFDVQYARYKIYMQHNRQPKYLIQNMDIETLGKSETPFMREQFLPYLGDSSLKEVLMGTIFPAYYFYFPFLKYYHDFKLLKIGILEYLNLKKFEPAKTYKGYETADANWNHDFEKFKAKDSMISPVVDAHVLNLFDEFLSDCKKRNIQVIIVCCPQYYKFNEMIKNKDGLTEIYEGLSRKYNFPVLDYTSDSLCYDLKYFGGPTHLNKKGSELFSVKLANDIKKLSAQK